MNNYISLPNRQEATALIGIAFACSLFFGYLDYETHTLWQLFTADNLPALLLFTSLFALLLSPVIFAIRYIGCDKISLENKMVLLGTAGAIFLGFLAITTLSLLLNDALINLEPIHFIIYIITMPFVTIWFTAFIMAAKYWYRSVDKVKS